MSSSSSHRDSMFHDLFGCILLCVVSQMAVFRMHFYFFCLFCSRIRYFVHNTAEIVVKIAIECEYREETKNYV